MRPTPSRRAAEEHQAEWVDECLVNTATLAVGTFRAHPSHPEFRCAGRITDGPSVVFPRANVWIHHQGKDPFVADSTIAVYYNLQQPYTREKLSKEGDHCDWFHFAPEVLAEVVRVYEPRRGDQPNEPFSFAYGPADNRSYLLERLVVRHIRDSDLRDLLFVEETMLHVLERIIDNTYDGSRKEPSGGGRLSARRAREVTQHAKATLAERFCDSLTLAEIAQRIGFSVFHLCRLFRQHCGTTLHKYRTQLRVRAAVDLLGEFRQDLTALAFHLGFSSHSHFTASFRQAFGCTPSQAQKMPPSRLIHGLGVSTLD